MKGHNQRIGKWGEQTAAEYLISRGYQILAVNHRTPFGELDLVTLEGGMLVFIEVKTRTSGALGYPEGSVTPTKQAHITNAALYYMANTDRSEVDWRVDVVAITGEPHGGVKDIQVFQNALQA
jgi:putative endonuclease